MPKQKFTLEITSASPATVTVLPFEAEQVSKLMVPPLSVRPAKQSKISLKSPDQQDVSPDPLDGLDTRIGQDDHLHTMTLCGRAGRGRTLREAVLSLGRQLAWGEDAAAVLTTLRAMPESINRQTLIDILETVK